MDHLTEEGFESNGRGESPFNNSNVDIKNSEEDFKSPQNTR